jgi:hypothetical protein
VNQQEITKINEEIKRLQNKIETIKFSPGYSPDTKEELESYIGGRIDGLKWVKENV